ncbi:MAG: hypothetical protein PHN49_01225 [Candidatus Omnitrophica bacterium]|nr:hypothetical protein [Candidatus Omnitrophota bacterium]
MKSIKEIKMDLAAALEEIPVTQGLNTSDRVQMAIALLSEYGKYNRGEAMSNKANGTSQEPATEKQKFALEKNGVDFSENITKSEASALLDKVMPQAKSISRGRFPARSFPK